MGNVEGALLGTGLGEEEKLGSSLGWLLGLTLIDGDLLGILDGTLDNDGDPLGEKEGTPEDDGGLLGLSSAAHSAGRVASFTFTHSSTVLQQLEKPDPMAYSAPFPYAASWHAL